MSEEKAKWLIINMIWVEDKEITVGATDNERWSGRKRMARKERSTDFGSGLNGLSQFWEPIEWIEPILGTD